MPLKKPFLVCFILFYISPVMFAMSNFGTYTYNIDTVFSMMQLSLIEDGLNPTTEEFQDNVESAKSMILAFGEEAFISNMKSQSPFSCIEIQADYLVLKLNSGDFRIPIEILENEVFSKAPDNYGIILGYFKDNKLYFNFIVTFEGEEQASILKENRSFYMIPFGKQV
jgi:hypothetical protein